MFLEDFSNAYILILNLIVIGVVATVIVNTLLMSVFERTREIGILTAIGMKGRQIVALFLTEAGLLAIGGLAVGLLLGWGISTYFSNVGVYFGDLGISGFYLGDRIFPYLTMDATINLTITSFIITILASLYPARMAARMEPVDALHGVN